MHPPSPRTHENANTPTASDIEQSGMVKNFATISERGTNTSLAMVNSVRAEIYKRWLPHVGETEAREQAQAFALRFHFLIDGPLAPCQTNAISMPPSPPSPTP
jgi:hypothetical protein